MQDDSEGPIHFHYRLPESRALPRYKMIRSPPRKITPFIMLSDSFVLKPTHWLRSRTSPCSETPTCEGCLADVEVRWKCYLFVYSPATNITNCLELTDHAGQKLQQFQDENGSLRGYKLTVWRDGKKDNSPVDCSIGRVSDLTIIVPTCPNIEDYLRRIWYTKNNREKTPADQAAGVNRVSHIVDQVLPSPAPSKNGNGKPKKGH